MRAMASAFCKACDTFVRAFVTTQARSRGTSGGGSRYPASLRPGALPMRVS
jgi:hypothetical protein